MTVQSIVHFHKACYVTGQQFIYMRPATRFLDTVVAFGSFEGGYPWCSGSDPELESYSRLSSCPLISMATPPWTKRCLLGALKLHLLELFHLLGTVRSEICTHKKSWHLRVHLLGIKSKTSRRCQTKNLFHQSWQAIVAFHEILFWFISGGKISGAPFLRKLAIFNFTGNLFVIGSVQHASVVLIFCCLALSS